MNEEIESGVNFSLSIYEDAVIKNGEVVRGRKVDEIKKHNMVTLSGLNLIRDWFHGSGEYRTIKYVALGSGTYAYPTPADTWLVEPHTYLPLSKVNEDIGRVRLTAFIGEPDYNGYYFSEAALVTGTTATGNVLYARIAHERKAKSSQNTFAYAWECWWSL